MRLLGMRAATPDFRRPPGRRSLTPSKDGALLISHPIVLAELFWMLRKVGQEFRYDPYVQHVRTSPIYRVEAVVLDDVRRLADFDDVPEMHDRLIVIAADRLGATLITNDRQIRASAKARCLW